MVTKANQLMRRCSPLLTSKCAQCGRTGFSAPVRNFSLSVPSRRQPPPQQMQMTSKDFKDKMESRQSRRVDAKTMPVGQDTDDLGLIPQTIVRPPNSEMPALLGRKWKTRLKVEWRLIRGRFKDFVALVYFVTWNQRKLPDSQRPRLDFGSRQSMALYLHKTFYTSLAAATSKEIGPIACTGLTTKSRTQISQRRERQIPPWTWTRVKFTSLLSLRFHSNLLFWPLTSLIPYTQAKIMSDRAINLPVGTKNSYVRQCIVRIKSRQRLDHNDGITPSKLIDLTEYVVMQRLKLDTGEEEANDIDHSSPSSSSSSSSSSSPDGPISWKLWGTVDPTPVEDIEKLGSASKNEKAGQEGEEERGENESPASSWTSRISAMMPTRLF